MSWKTKFTSHKKYLSGYQTKDSFRLRHTTSFLTLSEWKWLAKLQM